MVTKDIQAELMARTSLHRWLGLFLFVSVYLFSGVGVRHLNLLRLDGLHGDLYVCHLLSRHIFSSLSRIFFFFVYPLWKHLLLLLILWRVGLSMLLYMFIMLSLLIYLFFQIIPQRQLIVMLCLRCYFSVMFPVISIIKK